MSRTLRGTWARRGTLLPLFALVAVVVGGVVVVLGLSAAAGTRWSLAMPLILLGLVAVPVTGRELASVRRGEIGVARLRGVVGPQLYAVVGTEPLLVIVVGALAGVGLGVAGGLLAGRVWFDGATPRIDVTTGAAVLAVVVVSLVAVLGGMAGAMNEQLSQQVSIAERPRAASTLAVFGSVLILVAAVVATYRASVAPADPARGDPDWVVLAGPALVGLGMGQLLVWVVRGSARLLVRRTVSSGLAAYLSSRRLARLAEAVTPLRLVVAAAVVAGVSLTGAQQVGAYADQAGRLESGAPYQFPTDATAPEALALTRRLDPHGDHLMTAVFVPGEGSVVARRAFLDLSRYDAVVGDFFAGTGVTDVEPDLGRLTGSGVDLATGHRVVATVAGVSSRDRGALHPHIRLTYASGSGTHQAHLDTEIGLDGGPRTVSARLRGCGSGCRPTEIRLSRAAGDRDLPWVVTRLDVAGRDALSLEWESRTPRGFNTVQPGPLNVSEGMLMTARPRVQTGTAPSTGVRVPFIATRNATWESTRPQIETTGGADRPGPVVARTDVLPFVQGEGLLGDLPTSLVDDPPTVPAAEVMVLAAADTPQSLLDQVTDAVGHRPRTLADFQRASDRQVGALQARVYALMALFCLLVALLVLGSAVSRQRAAYAREVAVLRLLGLPRSQVRSTGRLELLGLAAASVVATVIGVVIGVRLLIGHLPVVHVPEHGVELVLGFSWPALLLAVLAAALTVLVVGWRSRNAGSHESRPAVMREVA